MVIPGFVLAGGESKRMGRNKALIRINGVAMASMAASVLHDAGCRPVALVGRQPQLDDLGWPVHRDCAPGHHPLFGIAAALQACRSELALFTPCDLVGLKPAHIALLLQQESPCVAEGSNGRHPLLAVLPTSALSTARELANAGAPAHRLVEHLPALRLPDSALVDVNRPLDLPLTSE